MAVAGQAHATEVMHRSRDASALHGGDFAGARVRPDPVQVLVVDDHALVRAALVNLLGAEFASWSFHECASVPGAMSHLAAASVDLLILNMQTEGVGGGATIRALRAAQPATRVVVLTRAVDPASLLDCLVAGAHAYLETSQQPAQVIGALVAVLNGETVFCTSPAEPGGPLAPPETHAHRAPPLTARQRDVLRLLNEGLSTKEIARRLHLGIGTVKVHLAGVYRGLGARNRTEAVAKAAQNLHNPSV